MATPNRRATERTPGFTTRKGDFVALPPLNREARTARDLAKDPRVKSMDFDSKPGSVIITLNDDWRFSEGPYIVGTTKKARRFDLWEQARNAVRRCDGPSIRKPAKAKA